MVLVNKLFEKEVIFKEDFEDIFGKWFWGEDELLVEEVKVVLG